MPPPGAGAPPGPPPPKGKGKGASAGPPGPPPPKGGFRPKAPPLPSSTGAVTGADSGPRLRPIFWTAVQQVQEDSVWGSGTAPARFDAEELERCFALAETKGASPSGGAAGAGQASQRAGSREPAARNKRVRVLDDRTSQKLAIAFQKLPPPDAMKTMLETLEGFPEALSSEALLALHGACSEQRDAIEQLKQLQVGEADIYQLDMPERYLWILSAVDRCQGKLACGALLVGAAGELGELRSAGHKVAMFCRTMRESVLLRKCVSTALAVGNCLNRGTARAGAKAIQLPEALLKLDELRGQAQQDEEDRGASLLDFVARALVEDGCGFIEDPRNLDEAAPAWRRILHISEGLQRETRELLDKVNAAKSVALEEVEGACNAACGDAELATKCVKDLPQTRQTDRLRVQVAEVRHAVREIQTLVQGAKSELEKTQQWSSAKTRIKNDDWFQGWASFLEQLCSALGRVAEQASKRQVMVGAQTPRTLAATSTAAAAAPPSQKPVLEAPAVAAAPSAAPAPAPPARPAATLFPGYTAAPAPTPLRVLDDNVVRQQASQPETYRKNAQEDVKPADRGASLQTKAAFEPISRAENMPPTAALDEESCIGPAQMLQLLQGGGGRSFGLGGGGASRRA